MALYPDITTSQQVINEMATFFGHLKWLGCPQSQIDALSIKMACALTKGKPQLINELRKRWTHKGSETDHNCWWLGKIAKALGF